MRVAISGIAALTPIGHGPDGFRAGLREGRDGVRPIAGFDAGRHRVRRAAEVEWRKPEGSTCSRATEMALHVAFAALDSAGLAGRERADLQVGVILASNQGGMPPSVARYRDVCAPYRRGAASGALAARMLDGAPSATADLLAARCGATGPTLNVSTACSAGAHALGLCLDALRTGAADVMLVASVEVLTELALAGFGVLRALTEGEGPRPFDRRRDGTLLGEGAAALVLEDAERARARGAGIWAEVAGYGSSTDATHMTRPDPDGPARAMRQALGATPLESVDWIKAHGTATPANDVAEAEALRAVFGRRASAVPVTSLKAALGHSLGASGAVEAVGTLLAMQDGFVPPTLRVEEVDPECDLDVVRGAARPCAGETVLMNAFGFGGNNASVLLRAAH
jgi:3-oxoacyl-[acyl-carrier-protein] synthase II